MEDVTTHRGESHTKHRLTWRDVRFIREHPDMSNAELARMFGVERSTVRMVRANVSWRDPAYSPTASKFKGRALAKEFRTD